MSLKSLLRADERDQRYLDLVVNGGGEFVLTAPGDELPAGWHELDGVERMSLAALSTGRPSLVVEGEPGEYIVLVDGLPDPGGHTPLGLDDAEVLADPNGPVARYGRRDEDILTLTPWGDEDRLVTFDPDDEQFDDVALVTLKDEGLEIERGTLEPALVSLVREHLAAREDGAGGWYGVLTNLFGEFVCVPVGGLIAPHEDVRRQAVLRATTLLDGSRSLSEAAERLRAFAERLNRAEQEGWTLTYPVTDDLGFPERR
ncbi:MAG: hypothetical protein ACR2MA_05085 [Egibacteraceae bacterium]